MPGTQLFSIAASLTSSESLLGGFHFSPTERAFWFHFLPPFRYLTRDGKALPGVVFGFFLL